MGRALAALALSVACGGQAAADAPAPSDAGVDAPVVLRRDGGTKAVPYDAALDRVTFHGGHVVASPRVVVVYVGTDGVDAAPSMDGFVDWLVSANEYWAILAQYGVAPGARVASVHVPRESIVPASLVGPGGLILAADLDQRVRAVAATLPEGNAYVVMLPTGVDVALGMRGSYTYQTCIDVFGYHAFDGAEAYAVLPACDKGRSTVALSHELAELATDPDNASGWFSDVDAKRGEGEIGDLCDGSRQVEGSDVSRLWSNDDGECMPH